MAISYVAGTSFVTANWETSVEGSLNVGSNAGRFILGFFGHHGSDAAADIAASDITYASSSTGVTLGTLVTFNSGSNEKWRPFYIAVPGGTTGSNTLKVNDPDNVGRKLVLIAAAYDGVSAVSTAGNETFPYDYTNNPFATVTSATGEEVVALIYNYDINGATLTASSPATLLTGLNPSNADMWGLRQDGASGNVNIDGTFPGSNAWLAWGFSLTPSSSQSQAPRSMHQLRLRR